jgi:hypothetical protein
MLGYLIEGGAELPGSAIAVNFYIVICMKVLLVPWNIHRNRDANIMLYNHMLMDMRFVMWNVKSTYKVGSLMAVAKEISTYKLDLVEYRR